MSQKRMIFGLVMAVAVLAGCRSHAAQDERPGSPMPTIQPTRRTQRAGEWREQPLSIQQPATAVTQGPSPLVHIFDVPAAVRVVDETRGGLTIAAGTVGPQTLVRVDEVHGVMFGSENIAPGPLPAGHRYGIYQDPTTENVIRQGELGR